MLPSKCRIPFCTYCDRKIWATAEAKLNDPQSGIRAGQSFPLWPRPDSVYARLETSTGYAPGIAFCPTCAPSVGEQALEGMGAVVGYEGAKDRYASWYSEARETFLRAWLQDALAWSAPEIEVLIADWQKDCRG